MKRIMAFALCAAMIAATFTACGSHNDGNTTDIQVDESLLLDANVLTDYLCHSLDSKKQPEDKEFYYLKFVFNCFYYKDQPDFCYYDATPLNSEEELIINLDVSKKIMHQVFDLDWDITENVTGYATTVEGNNLLFTTGFGWGLMGYYPGEYVYSEFSDDNTHVVSHFELFGPDWDDGDIAHKSYSDYKIIYDVMAENNETFLRFNRFEKE